MQEKNKDFSVLKQRILDYLEYKGVSKKECYEKTGISDGVLSQKTGLGEDSLMRFLSCYNDVSPLWFLEGSGSMVRTPQEDISNAMSDFKTVSVPLIPIEAVAGFPLEDTTGINYNDCEQYSIPEFKRCGIEYVIRATGNSMYPTFSSGDILACKKIRDILFFQWGKIYVIDSSQGALVKRVFEGENPDLILLVSDNKEEYPPFSVPRADIRSLSIVLGLIRAE